MYSDLVANSCCTNDYSNAFEVHGRVIFSVIMSVCVGHLHIIHVRVQAEIILAGDWLLPGMSHRFPAPCICSIMQYGEQYTVAPPCSCGILVKMFVMLCTCTVTPLKTMQTESRINLLISVHYSCLIIYYSRKLKIHTATLKSTAFGVCCFTSSKHEFLLLFVSPRLSQ